MTPYLAFLAFLVATFVLAGIAPRAIRRPWVLLVMCLLVAASLYSTRLFG
jgi:hypothetical protein